MFQEGAFRKAVADSTKSDDQSTLEVDDYHERVDNVRLQLRWFWMVVAIVGCKPRLDRLKQLLRRPPRG